MKRYRVVLAIAILTAPIAAGCQRNNEITEYSVPRQPSEEAPCPVDRPSADRQVVATDHGPERMLAAIIARKENVRFFKLVGPPDSVSEQATRFRAFVESVHLADGKSPPGVEGPEGWQQPLRTALCHLSDQPPRDRWN